jgi:hypothetical protein
VNVIVQVPDAGGSVMVTVKVVVFPLDALDADAAQPAANETVAGPGVALTLTSNGVPTAALVGCDVIVSVLGTKLAVNVQFCVTAPAL